MSGHSKWAQIKHKRPTDAKRGKSFTKIVKEISVYKDRRRRP